jgi:hypothetical protein
MLLGKHDWPPRTRSGFAAKPRNADSDSRAKPLNVGRESDQAIGRLRGHHGRAHSSCLFDGGQEELMAERRVKPDTDEPELLNVGCIS